MNVGRRGVARSGAGIGAGCRGWPRARGGTILVLAAGCAGPWVAPVSMSFGTHAEGAIVAGEELPPVGDGYVVPEPWRLRESRYGSGALVGLVVRSARRVVREEPGAMLAVGDLSHRGGGASVEHKSHQNGRDVDLFFYALDAEGRPVPPGRVMVRFDAGGRAARWSPPAGTRAPAAPVPTWRFDARRTWALVRALLEDPEAEVQWIFIHQALAARVLEEARARGVDDALFARASALMRQPADAEPHDDHMHVRIFCPGSDRVGGCADKGPVRWWKKRWKYMLPPFGRSPAVTGDIGAVVAGEAPLLE